MKAAAFFFSFVVVALLAMCTAGAGQTKNIDVALIWHVRPSEIADPQVRTLDAGLSALDSIGTFVRALAAHPGARAALAVGPDTLEALRKASVGNTVIASIASGELDVNSQQARAALQVLAGSATLPGAVERSSAARRFSLLATNAQLALGGERAARMSQRDLVDLAGLAVTLRLAAAKRIPISSPLLRKEAYSARDLTQAANLLARADGAILDELRAEVASGKIEAVALPAHEPVLPLLVDAAGATPLDPNAVALGAKADAAAAIDGALRAISSVDPAARSPGLYSPYGAYDDASAALIENRGARYALFSDRVLQSTSAGGSAQAHSTALRAAFHAYALQTGKTEKLAVLFWREDASAALNSLPATAPASAMGDRMLDEAREGAVLVADDVDPAIMVVSVDATGPWSARADRTAVIDHVAQALTRSNGVTAVTPASFAAAHPGGIATYGYPPASSAGNFDLWMGSAAQKTMWQALVDARKAAGGDAALEHASIREPLLFAEDARWYALVATPLPPSEIARALAQFRSLIAAVYRGANKPPPAVIAPVKLDKP